MIDENKGEEMNKKTKLDVRVSPITGEIFAGVMNKEGVWASEKQDVTKEAVNAVAAHLVMVDQKLVFEMNAGTYEGKTYVLSVQECEPGEFEKIWE